MAMVSGKSPVAKGHCQAVTTAPASSTTKKASNSRETAFCIDVRRFAASAVRFRYCCIAGPASAATIRSASTITQGRVIQAQP